MKNMIELRVQGSFFFCLAKKFNYKFFFINPSILLKLVLLFYTLKNILLIFQMVHFLFGLVVKIHTCMKKGYNKRYAYIGQH